MEGLVETGVEVLGVVLGFVEILGLIVFRIDPHRFDDVRRIGHGRAGVDRLGLLLFQVSRLRLGLVDEFWFRLRLEDVRRFGLCLGLWLRFDVFWVVGLQPVTRRRRGGSGPGDLGDQIGDSYAVGVAARRLVER